MILDNTKYLEKESVKKPLQTSVTIDYEVGFIVISIPQHLPIGSESDFENKLLKISIKMDNPEIKLKGREKVTCPFNALTDIEIRERRNDRG